MISVLLAATLGLSPSVITSSGPAPARYVRLNMNVDAYGIDGTATMLVDRQSGRYAEHLNIGPQTLYQGFDGTQAWQADATGMTAVQGNALDRGTVLAWGYLFAAPRPAHVSGGNVQYDGVPQTARFTIDPSTHDVRKFVLFNGAFNEVARFDGYRAFAGGLTAPQNITFSDDNGTWKARVTSVVTLQDPGQDDFAPPPRPRDASISGGWTSVPFEIATEIIIPIRIDDGPVMHFILDTGGQNVLLGDSAKRLRLHTVGGGTISGAGAGVIPTTFATVRSMRIGRAVMYNQPFIVLNTPLLQGIDGIVGFELLSRFAARVDYRTNTLTLASSMPESWAAGTAATPFLYRSRQPQVTGVLDGIPGSFTIDTGNSGVLDVNAPFAQEHNLWAKYRAARPNAGSLAGVGGRVLSSNVTIDKLELGSAALRNVRGDLTSASTGAEANPSVAANVGEGIFRNFSFVLNYPDDSLYFAPGGIRDMSGVLFEQRDGRIVVRQVRTGRAHRAGIKPGMILTSLNGRRVGNDLISVQARLEGQASASTVHMVFNGTKHVTLPLLNYL